MPDYKNFDAYDSPRDVIWDRKFDWVGKPSPVPTAGICEEPCKCVRINETWLFRIIPALLRVGHSDVWEGSEAEKERAFAEVDYLIGMLMACDCGTGGTVTNIENAPEYTITLSKTEIQNYQTNTFIRYATYNVADPCTVGVNACPSTTSDIVAYEQTLCSVLSFMVDAFARIFKEATGFYDESGNLATDVTDWIARELRVTAIAYSALSIFIPIPDELIVVPILIGGAEIAEEVGDFLAGDPEYVPGVDLSQEDKNCLACYLYQSLLGAPITFEKWREVALNVNEVRQCLTYGTSSIPDAAAVLSWLRFVNLQSTYFMLLEVVDKLVDAQQTINAGLDCPCCNISSTVLQTLKVFPTPDASATPMWPEYTGSNPFVNDENFYQTSSFSNHSNFPSGKVVMKFDVPIRITNDFRLRIIHQGAAAATHTVTVKTNCDQHTTTLNVGSGGGSTNETIFVSLPWLSQSSAERVRRIEISYSATNNQPLILQHVETRALLA